MEIKSVPSTVADYLKVLIFSGELAPGQKLLEMHIAEKLKISRPPLREALRMLERDQLVYSVPRKGTYVTELSVAHCREVYQAREMIELYAIDLLKQNKVTQIPTVEKTLVNADQITKPAADARPEEKLRYFEAIVGFHTQLVRTTGNESINDMFSSIIHNLFRYQYFLVYRTEWTKDDSVEDHRAVLELIKAGHYQRAKSLLRAHFKRARDLIIRSFIEQVIPHSTDSG